MSVAYCQIVRVLWKSNNIPGQAETTQFFNQSSEYVGEIPLQINNSIACIIKLETRSSTVDIFYSISLFQIEKISPQLLC